jgi:hypothetical protein
VGKPSGEIKDKIQKFRESKTYIIGVLGHRDLLDDNESQEKIKIAVKDKLLQIKDKLKESGIKDIALFTPLAQGADQLVADIALKINKENKGNKNGIQIIACYPWKYENNIPNNKIQTFEKIAEKGTYIKSKLNRLGLNKLNKESKFKLNEDDIHKILDDEGLRIIFEDIYNRFDKAFDSLEDMILSCVIYLYSENEKRIYDFKGTFDEKKENLIEEDTFMNEITEIPIHNHFIKDEKNDSVKYFDITSKFLVLNCDALIVLWDGVYTGNKGGTSAGYHDAINGFNYSKNDEIAAYEIKKYFPKERLIYHLSIPRKSNPYPVGRRYRDTESKTIDFSEYTKIYPYQWHTHKVKSPRSQFKANNSENNPSGNQFRKSYFWKYVVPGILIFCMTIFGIWAAIVTDGGNTWKTLVAEGKINFPSLIVIYEYFWNMVYKVLYLIKIPSGDLETIEDFMNFVWPKKMAIIFGILLIPYTLIITLIYALANDRRILAVRWGPKKYSLILGLGWKGAELAHNLRVKNRRNVVVIDKNPENANKKTAIRNGIKVIDGNFNDPYILDKVSWSKAEDIFILGKDDETNIRAIELIDTMSDKNTPSHKINIYAHIDDFRNKFFISSALRNSRHLNLTCFNIYENIIRKVLIKHPLDRLYFEDIRKQINGDTKDETKKIKVVILGFNEVARALLRYCFTQLIFSDIGGEKPDIEIQIYPDIDDIQIPSGINTEHINEKVESKIEAIKNIIPDAIKNEVINQNQSTEKCIQYTSTDKQNRYSDLAKYVYGDLTVKVFDLKASENDVIKNAKFLEEIKNTDIVSIFSCIDDGVRSSAYLAAILPALEVKKKQKMADIQAFCYFNFPEEKENSFIEERINNIASHVPVFFFGNFTQEFTEEAIKGQELDNLSRLINIFYYQSGNLNLIEDEKTRLLINENGISAGGNDKANEKERKTQLQQICDTFGIKLTSINEDEKWIALDEFKKESNRLAADHFFVKLRAMKLFLEKHHNQEQEKDFWNAIKDTIADFKNNKGLLYQLCELEHRRWCAERLFYGWRPIDSDRNLSFADWKKTKKTVWEPLKQHYDLVKFNHFTGEMEAEKDKDRIIIENMDLMFSEVGYGIKKWS